MKSWATPPASTLRLSSFAARRRASSAAFLSEMSIDTPSTAGRPVPENVKGIFVVCRCRTRPRASVIGSSRTTLGWPLRITSRSSSRKCRTSSSERAKSASVRPMSPSTVVP